MKKGNVARLFLGGWLLLMALVLACAPVAPAPTPTPGKPAAAPPAPTATSVPTPSPVPKAPYKVGVIMSLSGPFAALGVPERDAMVLVQEQINGKGGIKGHRLDLVIYDDGSDETKGILSVKKLIEEDKVLAVLGPPTSGVGMAIVPSVEEAKVPNINLASTLKVADPVRRYVFKPSQSERVVAEDLYDFLKKKGVSKIALLNQGAGFGRAGREYIEKTATARGFTLVAKEEYGPSDTDMRPQLTKIKGTDAEYLVVYGAEVAAALIAKQMKEMGMKIPMTGPYSIVVPAIVEIAGEAYDGMQLPVAKSFIAEQLPDADPQKAVMMSFREAFKKKYGKETGQWEGFGHDAVAIIAKALETAEPDPTNLVAARDKIRDAIENIKNFPLNVGIISFSPTDHEGLQKGSQVVVELRKGKFTMVGQ